MVMLPVLTGVRAKVVEQIGRTSDDSYCPFVDLQERNGTLIRGTEGRISWPEEHQKHNCQSCRFYQDAMNLGVGTRELVVFELIQRLKFAASKKYGMEFDAENAVRIWHYFGLDERFSSRYNEWSRNGLDIEKLFDELTDRCGVLSKIPGYLFPNS